MVSPAPPTRALDPGVGAREHGALLQALLWAVVAALHVSLATLVAGFDWMSVLIYAALGILAWACTQGMRRLSEARGWLELGLRGWLLRSVPTALLSGIVIVGGLSLGILWAAPLLEHLVPGFTEPNDLRNPNSLAGLTMYWSGIVLLWHQCFYGYALVQRLRRAELEKWELEAAVAESELDALRAHLNPHFVFNALNGIRGLIAEDPPRAREMVTRLSGILRSSLQAAEQETVALGDELDLVRSFLELESVRFEDRLRYEIEVSDAARRQQVPALIVQHLVENAIKHGLGRRVEPSTVVLHAEVVDGTLRVRVRNEGELSHQPPGSGLERSRRRLELLYGARGVLTLREVGSGLVEAQLEIPATT